MRSVERKTSPKWLEIDPRVSESRHKALYGELQLPVAAVNRAPPAAQFASKLSTPPGPNILPSVIFEPARLEHAKSIEQMRWLSAEDLAARLGPGPWNSSSRLQGIKERIALGDPETLRHSTLFVACLGNEAVGSVVVSTFPPGFWKRQYWQDPSAKGLGVFNLVVQPELQRQGIGRLLMQGVEQLARTCQIPYVRLDAFAENPISTTFYRRIGYDERAEISLRGTRLILFERQVWDASS